LEQCFGSIDKGPWSPLPMKTPLLQRCNCAQRPGLRHCATLVVGWRWRWCRAGDVAAAVMALANVRIRLSTRWPMKFALIHTSGTTTGLAWRADSTAHWSAT
jgi:hypothetical protein